MGRQNPPIPDRVARHCSNDEKLQLVPLKPLPKLAHQPPSARAPVVGRDRAASVIKKSGVVRINASAAACNCPIDRNFSTFGRAPTPRMGRHRRTRTSLDLSE